MKAALRLGTVVGLLLLGGGAATANTSEDEFPVEAMREFSQIFALIRDNYVDEIEDDELLRHAIRGMLDNLDPYSSYLSKEYFEKFNNSLQGLYGGVGLYIDQDRGIIRVVSPIDDSPAARKGLRANDFIVEIDGESTEGMAVSAAADRMRGKPGTPVTLSIVRLSDDERDDFEVEIIREEINSPSVRSALGPDGIGFVRISQFLRSNRTSKELAEALDDLYAKNGAPLRGLIIDLRNNPGGDLQASICVASVFLERGMTVVSDRGRTSNSEHKSDLSSCQAPYNVSELRQVNIALLVNNGSASASEIVAGALQDNSRAEIVGTSTFGKASVQRIFNIEATDYKSAIKLTSARYYTPAGKSIHKVGIQPDHEIEFEAPEREEEEAADIKADELTNLKEVTEKKTSVLPLDDNQYDKALALLQAKFS